MKSVLVGVAIEPREALSPTRQEVETLGPPADRVTFPTFDTLWRTLSPKRLQRLTALAGEAPMTVSEIAQLFGRGPGDTRRDVKVLLDAGLLVRTGTARVRFPYDSIRLDVQLTTDRAPLPQAPVAELLREVSWLPEAVLIEAIGEIARQFGVPRRQVLSRARADDVSRARRTLMLLLRSCAGATVSNLAVGMGMSRQAISRQLGNALMERDDDPEFGRFFDRVAMKLKDDLKDASAH